MLRASEFPTTSEFPTELPTHTPVGSNAAALPMGPNSIANMSHNFATSNTRGEEGSYLRLIDFCITQL